jgi:hypothetical protein
MDAGGKHRAAYRYLALVALALPLAVIGFFLFATLVAIYAGLWLHDEKMYYAQGLASHLFGATGAVIGLLLAWLIWRVTIAPGDRR